MKDTPNYYDCFIDSILSLPLKDRSAVLKAASAKSSDNNPYLYLWNCYCDLDNEDGQYIKNLLDNHSLALD
jgi:hypothetical protein